jgi:hypothetical protein
MTLRVTKGETLRAALGLGPDKIDTCKQLARANSEYVASMRGVNTWKQPPPRTARLQSRIEWLANALDASYTVEFDGGQVYLHRKESDGMFTCQV